MTEKTRITEDSNVWDAKTGAPVSKSRRSFMANAGMYGVGLAGSALLGACSDSDSFAQSDNNDNGNDPNTVVINGPSDQAVLNFALNLEYLEAEYYLRALTGSGLQDADRGMNPGTVMVKANPMVNFTTPLVGRYAAEIAADELAHVQFLRSALGGGAVAAPQINLQSSFNAAASAANLGDNFDPFANETNFLIGAFIFEDVGVSAYKGGSPFIRNRTFLEAAAGLLSVEAYHAGLVRTVLEARGDQIFTGNTTVRDVVDAISGARDSVDGADDIDQGLGENNTVTIYGTDYDATNIVPTDMNGLTFSRSPQQVHNVVYLTEMAVSPSEGSVPDAAFFPMGTNGTLTSSADNT